MKIGRHTEQKEEFLKLYFGSKSKIKIIKEITPKIRKKVLTRQLIRIRRAYPDKPKSLAAIERPIRDCHALSG